MPKLIGIQQITSKDNKTSYNLFFTEEFSPNDKNAEGIRCFSEWTRYECTELEVGAEYQVLYRKGFKDTAVFDGVIPA